MRGSGLSEQTEWRPVSTSCHFTLFYTCSGQKKKKNKKNKTDMCNTKKDKHDKQIFFKHKNT